MAKISIIKCHIVCFYHSILYIVSQTGSAKIWGQLLVYEASNTTLDKKPLHIYLYKVIARPQM